jgi:hexokinase
MGESGISASVLESVKGHDVSDIIDKDLSLILIQLLPKLKKIQILNDVSEFLHAQYLQNDSQASLVLGTGMNAGIIMDGQIINLEAGNFDKFEYNQYTRQIDAKSHNPGKHLLEKETSGKYLYQHYNLITGKEAYQSTEEMDKDESEISEIICKNAFDKIKLVQEAIQIFIGDDNLNWSYEGTMLEFLREKYENKRN